jgi:hypothetical protein
MKSENDENIYITYCPINEDVKTIMDIVIENDEILSDTINSHAIELENQGEEIFLRKGNMIATSSGYYFAFYEDYLEKYYEKKDISNDG